MRDATTTRGRELGIELRHIREQAGYNGHELAVRLGWSDSKVSRLETGRTGSSEVDVTTYLVFCGVVGDELDRLLKLAREDESGYRLQLHGEKLSDELRTLIIEETTAAAIRSYEPIFVPGLTQTEDYVRALLREGGRVPENKIETRVRARLDRQSLIKRLNPPECVFYVHEQALRVPVGGPRVMHEQLLHLLFLDTRPHCSVRVVPISAGGQGLNVNGFRIMDYTRHDPVVYVQTMTISLFLENKEDIETYRQTLGTIDQVALNEGRSREFLAHLASKYDRVDEDSDGQAWPAEQELYELA